jgi:transposase
MAMDILFTNVAGLDIHKKTIMACVRVVDQQGKARQEVRTFGTVTRDLLAMADWFRDRGVTHVAMESTGVYWKPVWNVLDGAFELLLVNPRELKQAPGRKSDLKDCQWIAQLLQCGLLRSSFVPSRPQRELRDLTRHRAQLVDEQTRVANRIHKVLEDANIKLGSVASDVLGVSGRAMLEALAAGERNPNTLAELAKGVLRNKIPQLKLALEGKFTDHHRFLVEKLLHHLNYLHEQIAEFSARIEELLDPFVSEQTLQRLDEVPGLNRRTIENVIAEIGADMSQFPSAAHLSSWAGMSPGNEESAGKRQRSRTTKGNRWLRRALCEAAWAAKNTQDSYLASQYYRLVGRRGKKRAIMAVGHSLLVIIYHLLQKEAKYQDLGADYFNQLQPERLKRHLVRRLEELGYEVELTPRETAA